jgi:hypothetical protein
MAWIVQALQKKCPETDTPLPLWTLCATSDDGGGFVKGCDHEHSSAAEASDCMAAKVWIEQSTGLPHKAADERRIRQTPSEIRRMVERFLRWKLPTDFNPDAGISFKAEFNTHTPYPMRHEPTGTNLFGYDQAEAMVRHMLAIDRLPEGAPGAWAARLEDERFELCARIEKLARYRLADAHNALPFAQRKLLADQARHMNAYADVLFERLKLAKLKQ